MADQISEDYDAIVLGTGLVECVLSGLLSTHGYKVLHLDRNGYYGGETASLNLEQLFQKFNRGTPPAHLGRSHLYNIDLIPKVLMCAGELVKILRNTVVERYNMEFMLIEHSFVCKDKGIHKVPVTAREAFDSKLMVFFEKRNAAKFFEWMANYSEEAEAAKGPKGYNLRQMTCNDLFKAFSLGKDTIDFIGHAVALHTNDAHLTQPAYATVMKAKLYEESVSSYDAPYMYPSYGSGELPQAFSRLSAVYGGTYMLQTPPDEICYDPSGKFTHVNYRVQGEARVARARMILGDTSYFPERVRKTGQVVRCIAITNHPIQTSVKDPFGSCQIIVPQSELKRRSDVYILQLSSTNRVCPEGFYVVIIGTMVENEVNPMADLQAGLSLVGPTLEQFVFTSDLYEPVDDGANSKAFISNSYDAATHFESAAANILDIFRRVHGAAYNFQTLQQGQDGGAAAAPPV